MVKYKKIIKTTLTCLILSYGLISNVTATGAAAARIERQDDRLTDKIVDKFVWYSESFRNLMLFCQYYCAREYGLSCKITCDLTPDIFSHDPQNGFISGLKEGVRNNRPFLVKITPDPVNPTKTEAKFVIYLYGHMLYLLSLEQRRPIEKNDYLTPRYYPVKKIVLDSREFLRFVQSLPSLSQEVASLMNVDDCIFSQNVWYSMMCYIGGPVIGETSGIKGVFCFPSYHQYRSKMCLPVGFNLTINLFGIWELEDKQKKSIELCLANRSDMWTRDVSSRQASRASSRDNVDGQIYLTGNRLVSIIQSYRECTNTEILSFVSEDNLLSVFARECELYDITMQLHSVLLEDGSLGFTAKRIDFDPRLHLGPIFNINLLKMNRSFLPNPHDKKRLRKDTEVTRSMFETVGHVYLVHSFEDHSHLSSTLAQIYNDIHAYSEENRDRNCIFTLEFVPQKKKIYVFRFDRINPSSTGKQEEPVSLDHTMFCAQTAGLEHAWLMNVDKGNCIFHDATHKYKIFKNQDDVFRFLQASGVCGHKREYVHTSGVPRIVDKKYFVGRQEVKLDGAFRLIDKSGSVKFYFKTVEQEVTAGFASAAASGSAEAAEPTMTRLQVLTLPRISGGIDCNMVPLSIPEGEPIETFDHGWALTKIGQDFILIRLDGIYHSAMSTVFTSFLETSYVNGTRVSGIIDTSAYSLSKVMDFSELIKFVNRTIDTTYTVDSFPEADIKPFIQFAVSKASATDRSIYIIMANHKEDREPIGYKIFPCVRPEEVTIRNPNSSRTRR